MPMALMTFNEDYLAQHMCDSGGEIELEVVDNNMVDGNVADVFIHLN
jgi:hypothetical protein